MGDLTQYFSRCEFACRCGCGFDAISSELVDRLTVARMLAGVPFRITSGCRCTGHNDAVGGVVRSPHLRGLAADIAAPDSVMYAAILGAVFDADFMRIGLMDNAIHVDVRRTQRRVAWTYYGGKNRR